MERTPELQNLLDNLAKAMKYEDVHILDIGGSHPGTCRCGICLRFWVLIGPEEIGKVGEYSFGPFTQEEYLAAGGIIPDLTEDYEEEEEWDIQP